MWNFSQSFNSIWWSNGIITMHSFTALCDKLLTCWTIIRIAVIISIIFSPAFNTNFTLISINRSIYNQTARTQPILTESYLPSHAFFRRKKHSRQFVLHFQAFPFKFLSLLWLLFIAFLVFSAKWLHHPWNCITQRQHHGEVSRALAFLVNLLPWNR